MNYYFYLTTMGQLGAITVIFGGLLLWCCVVRDIFFSSNKLLLEDLVAPEKGL